MTADDLPYTAKYVRENDPDRFLMTLMMPAEKRPALWALYAFNQEIAKTREVVTDTTLGLIRLQWWRDALSALYDGGEPLQNEILPDLAAAIREHTLPKQLFDDLLYAREFDLENTLPASLEGMKNYADYTGTPLLKLALLILDEEAEEGAAKKAAVSYGLTGLLRAVPFHAGQQRCYLPADIMATHNIPERDLYERGAVEGLAQVIKAAALEARQGLETAPDSPKFIALHNRLSRLYLRQIANFDYDIFDARLEYKPAFFHFRFLSGIFC